MLLIIAFATACSAETPHPRRGILVSSACPGTEDDEYYFPADVFSAGGPEATAARAAYSQYLRSGEAISLSCGDGSEEAYRLTWLHPYRPAIIIAVERSGRRWNGSAVQFEHPKTLEPWTVAARFHRELRSEEAESVRAAIQEGEFWEQPAWKLPQTGGPVWVLEVRDGRAFHVISRQGSDVDDTLKGVGKALTRLIDLDLSLDAS